MTRNSTIREVEKLEAAMEADPPDIVWEHNGHGVQIAVSIRDPHADHPNRRPVKPRKTA